MRQGTRKDIKEEVRAKGAKKIRRKLGRRKRGEIEIRPREKGERRVMGAAAGPQHSLCRAGATRVWAWTQEAGGSLMLWGQDRSRGKQMDGTVIPGFWSLETVVGRGELVHFWIFIKDGANRNTVASFIHCLSPTLVFSSPEQPLFSASLEPRTVPGTQEPTETH